MPPLPLRSAATAMGPNPKDHGEKGAPQGQGSLSSLSYHLKMGRGPGAGSSAGVSWKEGYGGPGHLRQGVQGPQPLPHTLPTALTHLRLPSPKALD